MSIEYQIIYRYFRLEQNIDSIAEDLKLNYQEVELVLNTEKQQIRALKNFEHRGFSTNIYTKKGKLKVHLNQ